MRRWPVCGIEGKGREGKRSWRGGKGEGVMAKPLRTKAGSKPGDGAGVSHVVAGPRTRRNSPVPRFSIGCGGEECVSLAGRRNRDQGMGRGERDDENRPGKHKVRLVAGPLPEEPQDGMHEGETDTMCCWALVHSVWPVWCVCLWGDIGPRAGRTKPARDQASSISTRWAALYENKT